MKANDTILLFILEAFGITEYPKGMDKEILLKGLACLYHNENADLIDLIEYKLTDSDLQDLIDYALSYHFGEN